MDSALESIDIPFGTKRILSGAFEGCKCLTSVTVPRSLESIGENAFARSGLEQIDLGKTKVKVLETQVFRFCDDLSDVILPNSLEKIKDMALGETGIAHIAIPKSVKSISDTAFINCKKLKSIK